MAKYDNKNYLELNRDIFQEPYCSLLSYHAKWLFVVLKELEHRYCTSDTYEFFRTDKDLIKDTGLSEKTLKKAKKELKDYASDLIDISSKPIWDPEKKKYTKGHITHYCIY